MHVVMVSFHRIASMVRQLRIEPGMQRWHQFGVARLVNQFRAVLERLVSNRQIARFYGPQLNQAEQDNAKKKRQARKNAKSKLRPDTLQMVAHKTYLLH